MKRFLLVLGCALLINLPQARAAETSADESADPLRPVVAGYGVDAFTVGEQLYATDFDDPENWDIQLQERADSPLEGRFTFADGMLDIYAPNTGCTAWLKRDFEGPLAIVYRFRCPKETQRDEGISPRDANNFWMASDPDPKASLFDRTRYTGDFGDYSRMHAYYASSGGRKNTSVRMRRYPHQNKAGKGITHLALTSQDKQPQVSPDRREVAHRATGGVSTTSSSTSSTASWSTRCGRATGCGLNATRRKRKGRTT